MKIPDRKSSGRIVAFTIGGAASAFGITAVIASASAANDSDPTRKVSDELEQRQPRRERRVVDEPAEHEHDRHEERADDHRVQHARREVGARRQRRPAEALQDPLRRGRTSSVIAMFV